MCPRFPKNEKLPPKYDNNGNRLLDVLEEIPRVMPCWNQGAKKILRMNFLVVQVALESRKNMFAMDTKIVVTIQMNWIVLRVHLSVLTLKMSKKIVPKTLPILVKWVRLVPDATITRVLLEYTSPALPVGSNPYVKKNE